MATEVYEVVISGILGGQFVQNVLHVQATIATPVNPFGTALLIAQDLASGSILENYTDSLPADYIGTSVRVRKIDGTGGPTAIVLGDVWTQNQGQRIGQISSAQVAPLIVWIGTTTPDKTGRTFLPGVSEEDIDQMILGSALVVAIQLFITTFIAGGTLGAGDTYVGAIWRRTAVVSDVIFAGQVSPLIGTQRRRLRPV